MQGRDETRDSTQPRARLQFEGMAAPVVSRVRHRGAGALTVSQPLPFLRISSGVRDEAGRAAHIRSVGVMVEQDTPHIVLELAYDLERTPTLSMFALPATAMGHAAPCVDAPHAPTGASSDRAPTVAYEAAPEWPQRARPPMFHATEAKPDVMVASRPPSCGVRVLSRAARREDEAPVVFRLDPDATIRDEATGTGPSTSSRLGQAFRRLLGR